MSRIADIRTAILDFAKKCGGENFEDYLLRGSDLSEENFSKDYHWFGLIRNDQPKSSTYSGLSIAVAPSNEESRWLMTLGVGLDGLGEDISLASKPGVRRLFSQLVDGDGFAKYNFTDLQSPVDKTLLDKLPEDILRTINRLYSKHLPVCQIVQIPEETSGKELPSIMAAFIAAYSRIRGWDTSAEKRKVVNKAIDFRVSEIKPTTEVSQEKQIQKLVSTRRFIVLQGAPGVGKTRMAKQIANALTKNQTGKVVFTQFHAETSYSDFIYGLRPVVNSKDLAYTDRHGPLVNAIELAEGDRENNVVLIIDEINRANLSNVLGECFYLFEPDLEPNVNVEIFPGKTLKELPKNLFVIGTMNTADRSLAVVDFALRRRFAWYTMAPQTIKDSDRFYKEEYQEISEIFEWFATDEELALQPGQGYFLADDNNAMMNRIRYELYPLIKEYLNEGLLKEATSRFDFFFKSKINRSIYQ